MKSVFLILSIFLSFVSFSQQMNYVEHSIVYDTSNLSVSGCGENNFDSLDFNGDNIFDLRITSWFEHPSTCGIKSVIEILMLDYNPGDMLFNGKVLMDSNMLIKNCPDNIFSDYSTTAYILSTDVYTNHTSGYYKIPFNFESNDGVHCGFLFVRYGDGGKTITIEGYSWNSIAGQSCSCGTGWLGLDEQVQTEFEKPYKYYNLLGQEVIEPHGLTVVLYENGVSKKAYFE